METPVANAKYTKKQWIILCTICSVSVANSATELTYPPLYPLEAASKGVTASEYGFLFGMSDFLIFTSSPFFGKYVDKFGGKIVYSIGAITAGAATMCFGLLHMVNDRIWFIILSFLIKALHSLGQAACTTAGYSVIISAFPDSPGTYISFVASMIGLGYIAGPTIGGLLSKIGGFMTPFLVLGGFFLFNGLLICITIPHVYSVINNDKVQAQILTILKIPSVFFLMFGVVAVAMSSGFNTAVLEPHIRQFNLGPMGTGALFTINAITNPISSILVGRLCDLGVNPKKLTILGSIFVCVSFMLIGPMPYIPIHTILWMVCLGLLIHGWAYVTVIIAAFVASIKSAVGAGFAEDITTFGIVTGVWSSASAFGSFVGSSIAGVLFDQIGFREATLVVIAVNAIFTVIMSYRVYCLPPPPDTSFGSSIHKSDEHLLVTNSTGREYGSTSTRRFTYENPATKRELFGLSL